jgi:hypothetical protein
LTDSERADAGVPVLLSTLTRATSDAPFSWVDASGARQATTVHAKADVNVSEATAIVRRTPEEGAAACAQTVEYAATLMLTTDDGAVRQLVTGAVTEANGLIQFVGSISAASFTGVFAPRSTDTVHVTATWSGEDIGVEGRSPRVQLRKLEFTDASGDSELGAIAKP